MEPSGSDESYMTKKIIQKSLSADLLTLAENVNISDVLFIYVSEQVHTVTTSISLQIHYIGPVLVYRASQGTK